MDFKETVQNETAEQLLKRLRGYLDGIEKYTTNVHNPYNPKKPKKVAVGFWKRLFYNMKPLDEGVSFLLNDLQRQKGFLYHFVLQELWSRLQTNHLTPEDIGTTTQELKNLERKGVICTNLAWYIQLTSPEYIQENGKVNWWFLSTSMAYRQPPVISLASIGMTEAEADAFIHSIEWGETTYDFWNETWEQALI